MLPLFYLDLNLASISDLIVATVNILPDFIDLVIGIAPIIIIITLIGFLVKFFDRILEMLNLR
jgi:hypothetical protein